jgi:hypothetical protein
MSTMAAAAEVDLYIYYQVAEQDAPLLAARVRAMQAALGWGQLKRRPGASAGQLTWMEIYQGVAPDFSARLGAAVAEHRLLELTAGSRHVETFIDLDTGDLAACA